MGLPGSLAAPITANDCRPRPGVARVGHRSTAEFPSGRRLGVVAGRGATRRGRRGAWIAATSLFAASYVSVGRLALAWCGLNDGSACPAAKRSAPVGFERGNPSVIGDTRWGPWGRVIALPRRKISHGSSRSWQWGDPGTAGGPEKATHGGRAVGRTSEAPPTQRGRDTLPPRPCRGSSPVFQENLSRAAITHGRCTPAVLLARSCLV